MEKGGSKKAASKPRSASKASVEETK